MMCVGQHHSIHGRHHSTASSKRRRGPTAAGLGATLAGLGSTSLAVVAFFLLLSSVMAAAEGAAVGDVHGDSLADRPPAADAASKTTLHQQHEQQEQQPPTVPNALDLIGTVAGYIVVVASAILKVPQIIAIVSARSAYGVSLGTYLIDTFVFGINASWGVAFGLPIATYGENLIIFVQIVVVDLLVGYHQKRLVMAAGWVAVLVTITALLSLRLMPAGVHETLFGAHIVCGLVAKLPQIVLTYKRKATGALSLITISLHFVGSIVRVLTTAQGVAWAQGKAVLMLSFSVYVVLNGTMLSQYLLYSGDEMIVRLRWRVRRAIIGGVGGSSSHDHQRTPTMADKDGPMDGTTVSPPRVRSNNRFDTEEGDGLHSINTDGARGDAAAVVIG